MMLSCLYHAGHSRSPESTKEENAESRLSVIRPWFLGTFDPRSTCARDLLGIGIDDQEILTEFIESLKSLGSAAL